MHGNRLPAALETAEVPRTSKSFLPIAKIPFLLAANDRLGGCLLVLRQISRQDSA